MVVELGWRRTDRLPLRLTDTFTKNTGIQVRIDGAGPTEGRIRSQLAGGQPSWDVVDVESYSAIVLGKEKDPQQPWTTT